MSTMARPSWIPVISRTGGPLYIEITSAIVGAVRSGRLLPGDRLPPHRQMARALSVDLTTVTRAYAGAQKLGLLEATTGRGTFVRADLAPVTDRLSAPSVIDMTMNVPPQPDAGLLHGQSLPSLLQDGLTRLLRHPDAASLLAYRWGSMAYDECAAGAAWMRACHEVADHRAVLVCPGTQSTLTTLLTMFAQRGDAVLCERMVYSGLRALAQHLGLRLVGVETDEQGMVPAALDTALHREHPKIVYCNPTIHNPTTATMGLGRRQEIAGILRRSDAVLVEDDAYGLLLEEPLPSISSMLQERAYYLVTMSKTLSPSLRMAYVAAPSVEAAQEVGTALRATALMGSGLLSALVARWITGGEAEAMLRAVRQETQARQRIAAEILPPGVAVANPSGHHVWMTIRSSWTAIEFVAVAKDKGLALVPAPQFQTGGAPEENVRIALGSAPDHATLRQALRAICAIHASPTSLAYAQVV